MFDITKNSIETSSLWTKERILDHVTQEQILSYYLNIDVQYNKQFCSPLRSDERPTCTFKRMDNGVILFRDWSESKSKDCFAIVQDMFNVDFFTALQIIARDMNLTASSPVIVNRYKKDTYHMHKPVHSEKAKIEVRTKNFSVGDIQYLKQYGLTSKVTNYYNVFGVYTVWVHGKLIYVYNKDNPAIAYYYGKDKKGNNKWKVYYYKNKDYRFLGNTNRINGWVQIPKEGKNLIITKSMKDVMCLAAMAVPAISMQAETQIPYDYIIDELKSRYENIYTLLDFDLTGVRSANKIRKLYNIQPLFLTNGRFGTKNYGNKDISDLIKADGLDNVKKLVNETLTHLNMNGNPNPNLNYSELCNQD